MTCHAITSPHPHQKKQHKSNSYHHQQIRHNHPSLFFAEESLKQKKKGHPFHTRLTLKHITWKKSYCIGARNHYQKIIHKTVHTIQYIKGDPVTD